MNHELISHIPLFSSLPPGELERLAATLQPSSIPQGSLLFLEGEADDRLYIVLEGEVEIIKALGLDGQRLLGVRAAGSFIGEMSLFSRDSRHTASVRARTPLQVLEMTRADFDALVRRHPSLAYEMMRILSLRLEESENLTIRDLLEKNRQLTQAYKELKAAQAQLIEKERLEAELDVARSIQRSILPQEQPRLAGFDFGTLIEPVLSVGGDLFDFIPLGRGRLGIAIGDVSGHGVSAAIFMALTYSLLRAEASRGGAPGKALRNVNRHLLGMSDSGMFVTVLYGILESERQQFTFVRAGHPSPLLLDRWGEDTSPPPGLGQPLGLFDDPSLDEQSVTVPEGGLLFLFTDGITEAADPGGQQFGLERLQTVLRAANHAPAQDLCRLAYGAVRAHCGAAAPHDDILLLALRAGEE